MAMMAHHRYLNINYFDTQIAVPVTTPMNLRVKTELVCHVTLNATAKMIAGITQMRSNLAVSSCGI